MSPLHKMHLVSLLNLCYTFIKFMYQRNEVEILNKTILSQNYYNDQITQELIDNIENNIPGLDEATLYYEFPLIKDDNGTIFTSSIMIISKYYGVLLFKCDDISKQRTGNEMSELDDLLNNIDDVIFSKLIKTPNKKFKLAKRQLSFNVSSALYIPKYNEQLEAIQSEVIRNNNELIKFFNESKCDEISDDVLDEIYSVIDSSTAMVRPKHRDVAANDTTSRAYVLKQLESEIAKFDDKQKYAALSQLEGPQRIRGLAGSGKTIILCMKAAILHFKNPNAKILYTFKTKSLYDYIEHLITRFYKSLTDGLNPDFDNAIQIRHAWGGHNIKGVYYEACSNNNIAPKDFSEAFFHGKDPFDFVCNDLLTQTNGKLNKTYDYVLIDEAQDFKPSFYQICREIVSNDCIVWCYDELQNIFEVDIQDTVKTFSNNYGAGGINLGELQQLYPDMDNDIVLPRSYRNPKEILVMAHAIGFGIYNDKLIQMLQNNDHWYDLGYEVKQGNPKDGDHMIIERRPECSPLILNNYNNPDEIIKGYSAPNFSGEINWVCNEIITAINEEKLRADDIIVISIDDRNSKNYFNSISAILNQQGIATLNLSDNFYQKGFTQDDCVTLSTVYKAKGNEAAMVFVVGCDVVEDEKDDRTMRNKLFTAFTRAKAWLRISGMQIENSSLVNEIKKIKERNFVLDFTYKSAYTIQRDLNSANQKKAKQRKLKEEIIEKVKKAGLNSEDLDEIMNMIKGKNDIGDKSDSQ